MTTSQPKPTLASMVGIFLTVLTIIGMLCTAASSLQSKFDALDKRQQRIEDKVDTLMSAFQVSYVPATPQASRMVKP